MMQRMEWNGGLCHGEQKANSHKSGKNGLKMFVVVVVVVVAGAVSIFGPDALPVIHQWLLPGLEPWPLEWELQLITSRPWQLLSIAFDYPIFPSELCKSVFISRMSQILDISLLKELRVCELSKITGYFSKNCMFMFPSLPFACIIFCHLKMGWVE